MAAFRTAIPMASKLVWARAATLAGGAPLRSCGQSAAALRTASGAAHCAWRPTPTSDANADPTQLLRGQDPTAPVSTSLSTAVSTPVLAPVSTPLSTPVSTPLSTPVSTPLSTPVSTPVATPVSALLPSSFPSPSSRLSQSHASPSSHVPRPQPFPLGCEGDAATGRLLWAPTEPIEGSPGAPSAGSWASSGDRPRGVPWKDIAEAVTGEPGVKRGGRPRGFRSKDIQEEVTGVQFLARGTACRSGGAPWLSLSGGDHSAHTHCSSGAVQMPPGTPSARFFTSPSSSPSPLEQTQGGQKDQSLVTHEVVMGERVRMRPPPKPKPHSPAPDEKPPPSVGGSPRGSTTAELPPSEVGVGLIRLNRPKALNALCEAMMGDFSTAMASLQGDPRVGAVVVTGSSKAFAAGADIPEMQNEAFASALGRQMLSGWEAATHGPSARKPIIAAVNGYALGGGCELAMMCDIILVGETAVFGQPEVTLGVIPGMGGTQRLVRAVGKARAMEMVLGGGSFLTASEAVQLGLASRLVEGDPDAVVEEALALGARIASMSAPVVALAKGCVNAAFESTLSAGLDRERTAFYATFSLEDQKEGMAAFVEKREPSLKNK